MIHYYILDDDHNPVAVDLGAWSQWMAHHDRVLRREQVDDNCVVSTVFLGLDHRWWDRGPPLIFETMVFSDDEMNHTMWRCSTWVQALAQHDQAVMTARNRMLT